MSVTTQHNWIFGTATLALSAALAFGGGHVTAQDTGQTRKSPFDNPQNLQVLPKDISSERLGTIMRGISLSVGKRCSVCHVAKEDAPLAEWNFASDEKRDKRVAREMLRMVGRINGDIAAIDEIGREGEGLVRVTCATCHRGVERPKLIETILDEHKAKDDADGAVQAYSELRQIYYGSHSYDFSPDSLGRYAEDVGKEGKLEFALALHRLNTSLNPEATAAQRSFGNTLMKAGDFSAAVVAYEKVVAANPDSRFDKQLLEQAKAKAAAQ